MSPFMTVKECAEYLRLSPTTVYRNARRKENPIPSRKHGGKRFFPKDDVAAWSIAQTEHPKIIPLTKFEEAKQRLGI